MDWQKARGSGEYESEIAASRISSIAVKENARGMVEVREQCNNSRKGETLPCCVLIS